MIAVIADDLTGAAELGGIGLRYKLSVEVCMDAGAHSNPDLLIISTDTRSGSRQAAELEMARMTQAVSALNPSFIFKKIDSVLRGHVLAETQAQFKVLGYSKALFVPANPTLGRTIKSGTYFIDGKPIHKTGFAFDPEFPIRESEIIKMLGAAGDMVNVHPPKDRFIHTGIVIGEAESEEDLKLWAALASESILLGGASGFFSALLEKFYSKLPIQEQQKFTAFNQPALYVCGSAFQQSNDRVKAIKNARGPVSYLPPEAVCSDNENRIQQWADEAVHFLQKYQKAVIAIDPESVKNASFNAVKLRKLTAAVVKKITGRVKIEELLIEGGSTASAVLNEIGIKKLVPVQELAPGIIRSETENHIHITLKPGSYNWPQEAWMF